MPDLTTWQRGRAVKLWNQHRDLEAVADLLKAEPEDVKRCLQAYADFPGHIYPYRGAAPQAGSPRRAVPSLPKLSFLEKDKP